MKRRVWMGLLALVLAAMPVHAQETRGNINGIVQDADGVVPGAAVRITNTNTGQTQQLVSSDRGYFEAVLLNPGTYAVRVELQGYSVLNQTGISLSVGQTVSLTLQMRIGQLTEQVNVVAEAPMLDTTTVSSGQNFGRQLVEGLPMPQVCPSCCRASHQASRRPILKCRTSFRATWKGRPTWRAASSARAAAWTTETPATTSPSTAPSTTASVAVSPTRPMPTRSRRSASRRRTSTPRRDTARGSRSDMMTRAGTNRYNASANYSHWNNEFNSPNVQQQAQFRADPRIEDAWRSGRSHIGQFTIGGPVVVPKVFNGRNKAFFFFNFSRSSDSAPGRLAGNSTVPANRKHLEGDFSDLLLLPSGAGANTPAGHHQYQI